MTVTCFFWQRGGASGGDLVLVRESAEDLFSVDPVLGEVDLRWPGASLSGCELAEDTVGPGCVVVQQVFGQHPAQMVLIDDQHSVQELAAQGADNPSQIAFALAACGGLARILMPSAASTASKEPVNWPARSLIRNLTEAVRWPRACSRTIRQLSSERSYLPDRAPRIGLLASRARRTGGALTNSAPGTPLAH